MAQERPSPSHLRILDEIIQENAALIRSAGTCPECGNSAEIEIKFKAQDRFLKAYALRYKKAAGIMGGKFNTSEDEEAT